MTTKLQVNDVDLDPGITLRYAQWGDLKAVTQLIYDVCEADGDTTVAVTEDEMTQEWKTPGFDIQTDGIVAVTADDRIVGFEEFMNEFEHSKLRTDGYVHPQFKGLGIATAMMKLVEERARKEIPLAAADARVYVRSTLDTHDADGRNVHESIGFLPVRYDWRMEITLDAAPTVGQLPAGIELRPFEKGVHDVAVWQAQNEAWRDHWGSHDVSFEDWKRDRFDDPEFDPSLWQIAWDGDEVAGFSLNRMRMGIGWIRTLGVRRAWRKRGLGLALLQHSFAEFYKRGKPVIGLGVDAQNPTGATRLYQRAGMHVASEFVTYEKELRAGRELEEEE